MRIYRSMVGVWSTDPLDADEAIDFSPDEEASFREHWHNNYGARGGAFDEYAPAYRYGTEMRRSAPYRHLSWLEAEDHLRDEWENAHPGSAWERFKAAIREGWDRITS